MVFIGHHLTYKIFVKILFFFLFFSIYFFRLSVFCRFDPASTILKNDKLFRIHAFAFLQEFFLPDERIRPCLVMRLWRKLGAFFVQSMCTKILLYQNKISVAFVQKLFNSIFNWSNCEPTNNKTNFPLFKQHKIKQLNSDCRFRANVSRACQQKVGLIQKLELVIAS